MLVSSMAKMHYGQNSKYGLQQGFWREQFRHLSTDVQEVIWASCDTHSSLAEVMQELWKKHTFPEGQSEPRQAVKELWQDLSQFQIPEPAQGSPVPSEGQIASVLIHRIDKFWATYYQGSKINPCVTYRNRHFSICAGIPIFARTNLSMFVC